MFIVNDGNGNREAINPPIKPVEQPKEAPKEAPKDGK